MNEQEIPIPELYREAMQAFYSLMNTGKITPEQILHVGMFFGWFSRLLSHQRIQDGTSMTLSAAVQELRSLAQASDTDFPGDAGYVERLQAIADFLASIMWMERV